MIGKIRTVRKAIETTLAGSRQWCYFSPAIYAQCQELQKLLPQYVSGDVIDLGCGLTPYRMYLPPEIKLYHTLDLYPRIDELTYTGDVQNMPMIADCSYDTALCFEVLEHLPRPSAALQEIYRILRPKGTLILSVPHLSRLHDQPHDYYRFTRYGIDTLLQDAGFEVVTIVPKGGLLAFLGHQISTVLLCTSWDIPIIHQISWFMNKWTITLPAYRMDKGTRNFHLFALGYIAIAKKPETL